MSLLPRPSAPGTRRRGAQIVSSMLSIEMSGTRPPNVRSDVRKLRCHSGLREEWVTNPIAMPWVRPKTPVGAWTPLNEPDSCSATIAGVEPKR